jgi:hypothetical protein
MRSKSNPEVAASREPLLVPLWEVGAAARPAYSWGGLPSLVADLVEMAEGLGMAVGRDWGDRPVVSEADARVLFVRLTAPPAPLPEVPRPRHYTPGITQPDPSTSHPVEVS